MRAGTEAHGEDPFHLQSGGRCIQILSQGETSRFGVLPVHTITDFLADIEDLDPGLVTLSSDPAPAIFTGAEDKLAQLE
eukprot:2310449-Rhodomonas_salina.1